MDGTVAAAAEPADRPMAAEVLKETVLGLMPARFHLPLRFWHARLTRSLEPELFLLSQLLGSKRLVVDVGANYGIYSYYLAKLGKSVEAFEPLPECALTVEAYASPHIRVHNVALSSAAGTSQLFTPVVDGVRYAAWSSFAPVGGPHETLEVTVRTLDDYAFEDVCLVKIDVEGHELDVLRGGAHTLRREHPVILVEIEQRHLNVPMTAVFEEILDCGYRGFFYLAGRVQPISAFSFAAHQQPYRDDPHHPAYVNNFLFFPRALPLPEPLHRLHEQMTVVSP
jgi:FkbM family methyltransferase